MEKVRIYSIGTSDTHWHDELHTEFPEDMAEAGKTFLTSSAAASSIST